MVYPRVTGVKQIVMVTFGTVPRTANRSAPRNGGDTVAARMGLFRKREVDPAEMDRLREEIAAIGARVDMADAAKRDLGSQVQQLTSRLDAPVGEPPTEPPPIVDHGELGELRAQVERLNERLEAVDARIESISTELANQISEISGEIDQLGDAGPPAEQVVDELREAQERLANEQARYQIAFRHDLATLADRLRRA